MKHVQVVQIEFSCKRPDLFVHQITIHLLVNQLANQLISLLVLSAHLPIYPSIKSSIKESGNVSIPNVYRT